MRTTIADVAAKAGVSKTTVSRVLNAKGDLDERTAARVRQVIDELGYVPSSRAVGLASGRTRVLGLLVPTLLWPWIGEVVQGAVDAIEDAGYGVLLFTCGKGDASMRRFAAEVSANSFDGLVVIEPEGTLDYIASLHEQGLPVVMIDDRANHPQFPSVGTTNVLGGEQAARHLLELGRTKPLVVRGEARFGCIAERLQGFQSVFEQAGLPIEPSRVLDGEFTFAGGRNAVAKLRRAGIAFDCVFAHNDLSAAGAMQAIHAAGMRIPQDVAVVGFDDVSFAANTDPGLTSVRQPLTEMGATAARMLLGRVEGSVESGLTDDRRVIPTRLVVRGSTVADKQWKLPRQRSAAKGQPEPPRAAAPGRSSGARTRTAS